MILKALGVLLVGIPAVYLFLLHLIFPANETGIDWKHFKLGWMEVRIIWLAPYMLIMILPILGLVGLWMVAVQAFKIVIKVFKGQKVNWIQK